AVRVGSVVPTRLKRADGIRAAQTVLRLLQRVVGRGILLSVLGGAVAAADDLYLVQHLEPVPAVRSDHFGRDDTAMGLGIAPQRLQFPGECLQAGAGCNQAARDQEPAQPEPKTTDRFDSLHLLVHWIRSARFLAHTFSVQHLGKRAKRQGLELLRDGQITRSSERQNCKSYRIYEGR